MLISIVSSDSYACINKQLIKYIYTHIHVRFVISGIGLVSKIYQYGMYRCTDTWFVRASHISMVSRTGMYHSYPYWLGLGQYKETYIYIHIYNNQCCLVFIFVYLPFSVFYILIYFVFLHLICTVSSALLWRFSLIKWCRSYFLVDF